MKDLVDIINDLQRAETSCIRARHEVRALWAENQRLRKDLDWYHAPAKDIEDDLVAWTVQWCNRGDGMSQRDRQAMAVEIWSKIQRRKETVEGDDPLANALVANILEDGFELTMAQMWI